MTGQTEVGIMIHCVYRIDKRMSERAVCGCVEDAIRRIFDLLIFARRCAGCRFEYAISDVRSLRCWAVNDVVVVCYGLYVDRKSAFVSDFGRIWIWSVD